MATPESKESTINVIGGNRKNPHYSNFNTQPNKQLRDFSGEGEDVLDWLDDFQAMAKASDWDDKTMMQILPSYLTGTAKRWYRCCVQYLDEPAKPKSFAELSAKMVQ